jgi:hypothetical protein
MNVRLFPIVLAILAGLAIGFAAVAMWKAGWM